jgi:transcriptional regulator with XRE-family HTH domain
MSIETLATLAGVDKSTVSKIENNIRMPSIDVLCRLCAALNVGVGDMVDCERRSCKDEW